MVRKDMLLNGTVMLVSQLLSALPSTLAMGSVGFGPPFQVLISLACAALVSAPIAAGVFAFNALRGAGRTICILSGAACSIVSFPVTYALKAMWDISTGDIGGDPSGTWWNGIVAMVVLTIGALGIATLLIPYICGGVAGYLIWRQRKCRRPFGKDINRKRTDNDGISI